MTYPRITALQSAWRTAPPANVSLAAIARGIGALKTPPVAGDVKSGEDFMADFFRAGGVASPAPGVVSE